MECVNSVKTFKALETSAEALLPADQPGLITEGLIELGALVCQKTPKCGACPLAEGCQAFKQGIASQLPKRSKKQQITELHRHVLIIIRRNHVLIQQARPNQVMAGLWHFPYEELSDEGAVRQWGQKLGGSLKEVADWPEIQHGFTRYKAILYPRIYAFEASFVDGGHWVPIEEVTKYPFCSGHRELARQLYSKRLKNWELADVAQS